MQQVPQIQMRRTGKANPLQLRGYDDRDGRMELLCLLNHLSPMKRVDFLAWVCSKSALPRTTIPPKVMPETYQMAREATRCDVANERLTMSILMDVSMIATNYAVDLQDCVAELVRRVRGRKA